MNKKLVIIALVCIVLLIFAGCQKANPASDFEYEVVESEGIGTHVAITKYIGTDLDVVIPKKIEDLPVLTIGNYAFSKSDIKSVVIADSVRYVGMGSFWLSKNLETVRFGKNVTTIERDAFYGCAALKEIILPEGLEYVGVAAFVGCSSAEKLYIPSSLKKTSMNSFGGMHKLKDVTIANGVEELMMATFYYNVELEEISFPASIRKFSDFMFDGSCKLEKVIFEGNAPEFGEAAFSRSNPDVKIYYKKGTKGWDTCPLREKYELIEY